MEKWVEIRKSGQFTEIGKRQGISPYVARLLVNRGVTEEEMDVFLHGKLSDLGDEKIFKDMEKAVAILWAKICDGKRIRVIGDYDIDGVCSAYILETAIRRVRRHFAPDEDIDYLDSLTDTVLPHRIRDGYGLNIRLIDEAITDGIDTIITCDNGIAAKDEIEYGKSKGLTIIVTDHHEIPYHIEGEEKVYELPCADAIVNPKQEDCPYPYKALCGGAVAYRLSQLLYKEHADGEDIEEFLEFAAFATIGDVMPLDGENRIIVKHGLKKLATTKNKGLSALMEVQELRPENGISPFHIGFVLGPCLNAAGRLETAEAALMLLRAKTREAAMEHALYLKGVNDERKELTEAGTKAACEYVDSLETIPDIIVAYLPDCHESLAGIIAGRLREKYNHPAFVLTDTEDGLKGSGRSIEEYDMYAGLIGCRELFTKFGGHKLAAGISMSALTKEERCAKVDALIKALNEASSLCEEDFYQKVQIDMVLPFRDVTMSLIEELNMLEPCGMGNKRPLFATRGVKLHSGRIIGKNRNAYKAIATDDSGASFDFIMFGDGEELACELGDKDSFLLTYSPDINEYRGLRTIQVTGKNIMGTVLLS